MFFPDQGVGVGLRNAHFTRFLEGRPRGIDWVEALTENYLRWENGLLPRAALTLEKIRAHVPVALHGVSLSIASADPTDYAFLDRLKELVGRVAPMWISDHLCWTGVAGKNTHDLLPLPYRKDFLSWVVRKIEEAQDYLGSPILIENVSSYATFESSEMPEWQFLTEVSKRSGCGILLDINNVYVNSVNHGFNPLEYLASIPKNRVGQIHLAGHLRKEEYIIDTHDDFVCDEVWNLYRAWTAGNGRCSTMIEWDSNIPEWNVLEREVAKIAKVSSKIEPPVRPRVPTRARAARRKDVAAPLH